MPLRRRNRTIRRCVTIASMKVVMRLTPCLFSPITGFFEGLIGTGANYALRGFVILIAVVLLLVALWRVMDPSGEKTQAMVKGVAEAA
jgi:hypothetical protein